jgi:hypothetical protein
LLKNDTLVNWGEDTNREDDTNGLYSWLESNATPTEQSDVTREWLLEPARSATGTYIMKQTNLEGMVEVRPGSIMAELEKIADRLVDPVETGSTSKVKTVNNKQFKFNAKGKLRKKECKDLKRTSTNIFDWFRKGKLRQPSKQNTINPAGREGREEKVDSVVAVVRQLEDPHHHSRVHTQLVGPSTITEKGVDLVCPAVWYFAEGQESISILSKQT